MKDWTFAVAVIIWIVSLIFSLWLGIGVMLIGGIADIVNGVQGVDLVAAILKIVFFEAGFIPAWIGYFAGWAVIVL